MAECRVCRRDLSEPGRCDDRDACAKRVQKRARKATEGMRTVKHNQTWERRAYEEAMGR